ncbi:MAG: T9SS type A sorting domain-containing protein [Bacteroidetes bacterium]|nr:T9SS type A sorting domain-containing protein [Bacteroidota bacterium]
MNQRLYILFLFSLTSCFAFAQGGFNYKTLFLKSQLMQTGNFGEDVNEIFQINFDKEVHEPQGYDKNLKNIVNKKRQDYHQKHYKNDSYKTNDEGLLPNIDTTFDGQPTGTKGIPNDNHIAISNEGKIISVQNSTIRVMDEWGKTLMFKSLYAFANGKIQGFTNYCYDPRVVYDRNADRFIVFFLHESKVVSNFGVLAFSKTNDPTGEWNFYKIPGNPLKNDKWSDFPILAFSAQDVFITLNLLSENKDWRDGFNQSIIWQISKKEGYSGDSLNQKLYYDIRHNSKAIWSICPVQGGFIPTNPGMYFLSVKPGDIENDTLFFHEIDNTLSSGISVLNMRILKTDKTYGLPPVAIQPTGGDTLQTNDCRVLGAIFYNNKIQYVQTSVIKPFYHSGIFHGIFEIKKSNSVTSTYIGSDSVDYAYPSISYAGNGKNAEQSSVITFSYVSNKSFPGTAAIYHTQAAGLPSVFSKVLRVKHGEAVIERLQYSQVKHERWGDYTGIQLQYNKPNTIWLSGSFGNKLKFNGTWIAKLNVIENIEIETDENLKIFPNPVINKIAVGLNFKEDNLVKILIYNYTGQLVSKIFEGIAGKGYNEFYMDFENVSNGIYFLKVFDNNSEVYCGKFIK